MSTFKSTSSGERPAGTALTLVLNWSYCTVGNPVNWSLLSVDRQVLLVGGVGSVFVAVESLEFEISPVGKLVKSNFVGIGICVDRNIFSLSGKEELHSEEVLFDSAVGLAVPCEVAHKVDVGGGVVLG